MGTRAPSLLCSIALLCASTSRAEIATEEPGPGTPRAAGEVNVLWPFVGISELKALLPMGGSHSLRSELLVGAYLDYAQILREDKGKTFILALMLGYRQFFTRGLHAELAVDLGLRHETGHPGDGATLNDVYVRAWPMLGYQLEVSPTVYVNARGGGGILVYRQTHAEEEKKLVPAADINVGFRL